MIFSPIVLIIPTYEFISFPFLLYNDPYCHLNSFKYFNKDYEYNEKEYNVIDDKINKSFLNWGFCFLFFFLFGIFSDFCSFIKDLIEFLILYTNFVHYMSLFICYFVFSFKYFNEFYLNDYYYNVKKFPQINLLSYIKMQNKEYGINKDDAIISIIKLIMIFLSIIGFIYLCIIKYLTLSLSSFLFIIWFIILLELIFTLQFPFKYFSIFEKSYTKMRIQ